MFFRKSKRDHITITIPEPCGEEWDKMQAVDSCHRHCNVCDKVLTDFSVMSDDELMLFFRHGSGNICGRFRKDQLNRELTTLPEKSTRAKWWRAAALLPLTLFSKNLSAQQLQTDSIETAQYVPSPLIPQDDSTAVANVNHDSLPDVIGWSPQPWIPGDWYVGGVPFVTGTYTVTICTLPVISVASLPPLTETALGAIAEDPTPASHSSPKNNTSRVAREFGAILPKNEMSE